LRTISIVSLAFLLFLSTECTPKKDHISWMFDMDTALAAAKKENKPLMVDFTAEWCPPCKEMESSTFSDPAVILKAESFIPIRIDIDTQKPVAAKYEGLPRAYGGIGIPNILFLSSQGKETDRIIGFCDPKEMLATMDSVLKGSSK
jgi:thiol:disulfide interchange protein